MLPPQTAVALSQENGNCITSLDYACPVMVQFDVAVFSICGTCYDDNAAVHTFKTAGYEQRSFITQFQQSTAGDAGEDAAENLYFRSVNSAEISGYEESRETTQIKNHKGTDLGNSINWEVIKSHKKADSIVTTTQLPQNLINDLVRKRPMSPTGGSLTESGVSISTSVPNPIALYPLRSIEPAGNKHTYNIGVGDKIYPSNWEIMGYNANNIEFYGFDSKNGEGVVVAKYIIKDNFYSCKEETTITNDTIKTEFVTIKVHNTELKGKVEVKGKLIVTAGKRINLETVEGITVIVTDENECEISVPVLWETKEKEIGDINISCNQMTIINHGTYHIRATYENLVSDWIEVKAIKA